MAITYVGQATGTTSATLPAHQAGDLILAFAYRDGNNTAPTVPSPFTPIASAGGSSNSSALAYYVATGSGTTTGTWTNATSVVFHVYRGTDPTSPIGANNVATGNSTTITYPALSLTQTNGTSWVAGFVGHRSTNTTIATAPSFFTNRSSVSDATDQAAGFDTNGGVTSWSAQTASVGGTASNWIARTVELEEPPPIDLNGPLAGSGSISASADVILGSTDGIRITEDLNRRVTEAGDRRVTENYVATGFTYDETLALSAALTATSSAQRIVNGTYSVSGAGTVLFSADITRQALLSIAGIASSTYTARTTAAGAAGLSGAGTLTNTVSLTRNSASSLSASGAIATAHVVIRNVSTTLVGSLAQLSATTFTASAVLAVSGQATSSATADRFINLVGPLNGTGTVSGKAGYIHYLNETESASGTISLSPQVIRNSSSSLSAAGTSAATSSVTLRGLSSLTGSGTLSSSLLLTRAASSSLQGTGSVSLGIAVTRPASASLTALADMGITPKRIVAAITLNGGSGVLTANGLVIGNIKANISSTGSLNGTAEMLQSASYGGAVDRRITEGGDTRITQDGNFRIVTAGTIPSGDISANATVIPYAEGLFAKNNGNWKAVTPFVYHNGAWVSPKVYINNNEIWKRVY